MAAQVERGDEVAYFFSGRHYPRLSGPRLKRWELRGVAMHEVINGPIVSGLELGTRTPELDLHEPRLEAAFERIVRSFRPEVVHFQELLCMPSSLIDVAATAGVATVMTLQDYGPLCSTLRLFDTDGRICERLRVGEDCALRNARAPATREPFVVDTYEFEVIRWHGRLRVGRLMSNDTYDFLARKAHGWTMRQIRKEEPTPAPADPAAAFQRRRELNVERLGRVGRLVAQSPRLAEIYAARGVSTERMTSLRFTLAHVERIRPRALTAPPDPIRFTTLGGCAAPSKGSELIVGALRALRDAGLEGRFRLLVLGGIDNAVRGELEAYQGVEIGELYERHELDALLEPVDVGIMPSIWEEAFAYSGVEMLAKGIPLIANPLGGMVEYAIDGETAWLNRSCSADELAGIMAMLIADPGRVLEMHERVVAARERIVRPMAEHVDAIEAVYSEVAVS